VAVLKVPKVVTALKGTYVSMIIWSVVRKGNVSSVALRVIHVVMMEHVVRIISVA
jgi:hypothetical protein